MTELDKTPHKVHWVKPRKPSHEYRLVSTSGDCLVNAGFPPSTKAVINHTILPNVGDLVHCNNAIDTINGFIKQVKSFDDEVMLVGTNYEDPEKNFEFYATSYYGVVEMAFDVAGDIVYRR